MPCQLHNSHLRPSWLYALFVLLLAACTSPQSSSQSSSQLSSLASPPDTHGQIASMSRALDPQARFGTGVSIDGETWKRLLGPGQSWQANPSNVDAQTDAEYSPEFESAGERYFEGADRLRSQPPVSERDLLGDSATRRINYWLEQRAYPLDSVPMAGAAIAAQQMQAMLSVQAAADLPQWQNIGPAPMIGSLMGSQRVDVSGRVKAIVVDKRNSDVVYAGTAQGGVWKTSDGGASWLPLTDNQASLAIGALALDPNNPDIVYAGTGEPSSGLDNYYGAGILKSTNGGQSWVRLGADVFGGMGISKIVIDPANSNVVYVASGVTGVEGVATPLRGIFKSNDGGQSWMGLLTCGDCKGASDLVVVGNTLFAGVTGAGVYRSQDGGSQWTLLTNNIPNRQSDNVGRVMLDVSPTNPNLVYTSIHLIVPNQYDGAAIFRTTDGGNNWAQVKAGAELYNFCGSQCWYSHEIAVDPTNPNRILLGGMADYSGQPPNFFIRRVIVRVDATNNSLTDLSPNTKIDNSLHPDMHVITFDPNNPQVIWAGNDGGVFRSSDGGQTWQARNNGLATLQFTGFAVDPTNDRIVQGGMQDNNKAFTTNGGATLGWTAVDRGDGGNALIDSFNPNIWYGTRYGKSFQRNDQGSAFTGDWEYLVDGISQQDRALFYVPIAADPSTQGVFYFGTFRLYRSSDRGNNWSSISDDLAGEQAELSAIAVAPNDAKTIYVGASRGKVQVTTNTGGQWQDVTQQNLPGRYVSSIAVSPTNAKTAYLAFNGFNTHTPATSGHIFKTIDGGAIWSDISSNLPDVPVLSILLDKTKAGTIYLGTDTGVFRSNDDGASWIPFNNGMPNVAVVGLAQNSAGTALFAATHGRSIFRVLAEGTPPTPTETATSPASGGSSAVYLPVVSRQSAGSGATPTPTDTVPATHSPTPTSTSTTGNPPSTNTPTLTHTPVTPHGTQLPTLPATSTPTNTPLPTATRTPGPTVEPTVQPQLDRFFDPFDNSGSGWAMGANNNCSLSYITLGQDTLYHNEVLQNDFLCFAVSPAQPRTDGVFEMRAAKSTAEDGSVYGLMFGLDSASITANSKFYIFWIDPQAQEYSLQKVDGATSIYLTPGANQGFVASSAIFDSNNINYLRVRRQGSAIRLFVNGIWLTTINDNSIPNHGYSGVVNWSAYNQGSWRAYFDDFEVNQIAEVYADSYDNDSSGWSVAGGNEVCQAVYSDSRYRTAVQPDYICVYRSPAAGQINGRFAVDVKRDESFYQTTYGLMLGEDGNFTSYYVFVIVPDTQSYALLKYTVTNGWVGITWDQLYQTAWLYSEAINSGTNLNRIEVERDARSFRLLVNGEELGIFYDLELQPLNNGYYGVVNWSSQFDSAIADFDGFRVSAFDPPGDPQVATAGEQERARQSSGVKPPQRIQRAQ